MNHTTVIMILTDEKMSQPVDLKAVYRVLCSLKNAWFKIKDTHVDVSP